MSDQFDNVAPLVSPQPDMSILTTTAPPPKMDFGCFGNFGNAIKEIAAVKSCPPDYIACSVLASVGAALANRRFAQPGPDWVVPAHLWMAIIGAPSSRKSPAMDVVARPIESLEAELQEGHSEALHTWQAACVIAEEKEKSWLSEVKDSIALGHAGLPKPEGAIAPPAPHLTRLIVQDTTSEMLASISSSQVRAPLGLHDELAALLGSMDRYSGGGGDRAFYLKGFNAQRHTVERKANPEPLIIERLSLPILGAMQPEKLGSTILKGDDDGFAARFLFCWPEPVPLQRVNDLPDFGVIERMMRRVFLIDDAPRTIPFSDDAADLFFEARQHCSAQSSASAGMLAGAWGKGDGLIARLALILEFIHGADEPSVISAKSVKDAFDLFSQYFMPMAERCFGINALPQDARQAAAMAKFIQRKSPDEINLRDLRRQSAIPEIKTVAEYEAATQTLIDANWLTVIPTVGPGRKAKTYRPNQAVYEPKPKVKTAKIAKTPPVGPEPSQFGNYGNFDNGSYHEIQVQPDQFGPDDFR